MSFDNFSIGTCVLSSIVIIIKIKAPLTSQVGDSGVKARPKKERREVELYTKTAVWGEVKSSNHLQLSTSNHLQLSTTFQRERRREFTRQGIKAPNNMETKKPRVKQVMMRVPVVPRGSGWDDLIYMFLIYHLSARRSFFKIIAPYLGGRGGMILYII